MSSEDLLSFVQKRPFEPFRIRLTDAISYEVQHPEMVMTGRRTAIIGLTAEPGKPIYERTVTVTLLHIVRVEPLGTAQEESGDGKANA
jgi:hypothetical protein